MINVLHLYYDLLNLYGENANTRCIEHSLKLNHIKVNIDYKSIGEDVNINKYDLIYISMGSEDNLMLALNDIKNLEIIMYALYCRYMKYKTKIEESK